MLRPLDAPRSLAEEAALRIRESILSGAFPQGEHLVESRIATQLQISRGPVREAFKLLRAEGLLLEEPRRGTFVVRLAPEDVRDIYGLRAAIEGRAARVVAAERDPVALAELHSLVATIDDAAREGDGAAVYRQDLAFHDALCRLSGNARLHEVFVRNVPMLRAVFRVGERVHGSIDDVADEHRPIVQAIESGDLQLAVALVEEHCELAGEEIVAYLSTLPER